MPFYNFKRNCKVYLVSNVSGNLEKYQLEVYPDLSFSQTFEESAQNVKTLHDQDAMFEDAVINRANPANFSFTVLFTDSTSYAVIEEVLTTSNPNRDGSVEALYSSDLYVDTGTDIFKLEKCVFERGTYQIQKDALVTVSISGTAAKLLKFGVSGTTIPGDLILPDWTIEGIIPRATSVILDDVELANISQITLEFVNNVEWLNYDTLHKSLNVTGPSDTMYPEAFVVSTRQMSGTLSQYVTDANQDRLNTWSTNSSMSIHVGYVGDFIVNIALPRVVFSNRINPDEIFTQVYDFRLTAAPQFTIEPPEPEPEPEPTYPPVNITPPSIQGNTSIGSILTRTPGVYTGTSVVVTGQWTRDGVDVPGQVGATYTTTLADSGSVISYVERATNALDTIYTSSSNSITIDVNDTTPDIFAFTDVNNVALGELVTSDTLTLDGLNQPTAISIVGGEYQIDEGNWTSDPGTISDGQTFAVRHVSSDENSTPTNTTLTIGGISDTFTSTTLAVIADTTPDTFVFTDVNNVALSSEQLSDIFTVNGINQAANISVTGGEYRIDGGAWTAIAGTIFNDQTFQVRHTASSNNNTPVNTTLTIGGVSDTFTSTTIPAAAASSIVMNSPPIEQVPGTYVPLPLVFTPTLSVGKQLIILLDTSDRPDWTLSSEGLSPIRMHGSTFTSTNKIHMWSVDVTTAGSYTFSFTNAGNSYSHNCALVILEATGLNLSAPTDTVDAPFGYYPGANVASSSLEIITGGKAVGIAHSSAAGVTWNNGNPTQLVEVSLPNGKFQIAVFPDSANGITPSFTHASYAGSVGSFASFAPL